MDPVTLLSTALTIVISIGAWFFDQKILGCKAPIRATLGLITLAIGTWIGTPCQRPTIMSVLPAMPA